MAPLLALLLKSGLSLAGGALVSKGLDYVNEKTGLDLKPTQDSLTESEHAAIANAQEQNYDEWFDLRRQELENEDRQRQRELENVVDARKMQTAALQSDSRLAKEFVYWFIGGWSLFSALVFTAMLFVPIPENNVRLADTFVGWLLGTALAGSFQFLLGTTVRNSRKDETISNLVKERNNG